MKTNELIAALQFIVDECPEAGDYEVAQQSCFDTPNAYTGSRPYVGTYYGTEGGGFLDEDDLDDELTETFPVVVIEAF